MTVQIGDKDN